MELPLDLIINVIELGCIYSLVVLGVFLSSKIIKFDDLTVDGSFTTGSAVTAALLISGSNAILTIILSIIAGMITGLFTGLLNTKLKLNNLISGIVVTTGLFSINLKIAGANATINSEQTIFNLTNILELSENLGHLIILTAISFGIILLINWLLKTEIGLLLKATGSNPQILTSLGKNIDFYKILCLILSNGITALAGSLFVQHAGFFAITGCIGTIAIALAGLIIGATISKNLILQTLLGAMLYQAIISLTLELQIDPTWNRLITAILIIMLISLRKDKN